MSMSMSMSMSMFHVVHVHVHLVQAEPVAEAALARRLARRGRAARRRLLAQCELEQMLGAVRAPVEGDLLVGRKVTCLLQCSLGGMLGGMRGAVQSTHLTCSNAA